MKKQIVLLVLPIFILLGNVQTALAWGATGHALVAEIAFHFLDDSTQKIVKQYFVINGDLP